MPSTRVAAGRLTSSPRLRTLNSLFAGLLTALWAASLVPLIGVASSNERLVEAFATDEAMQLNLLRGAAAKHSFGLTFGPYGHLVFNAILVTLRLMPGELTDARIVHTGRGICLLFAAATLWLTFVWTRRVFGTAAAWIALGALLVNPTLYSWAVILKPDMAQLFFLMLALALTCRMADEPRLRWLALASAAAGLAFACKYSGLFALPIIGAVAVWRPIASDRSATDVAALRAVAAISAIALIAGSLFLNLEWIASHLTEDGRIDARVSQQLLTQLTMAVRACGLALGVAAATPWLWSALRERMRVVAVLWSWCIASSVFIASFILASPYSLRKAAFVKGLFVEASDAAAPLSAQWLSTWGQGVATAVEWPVLVAALATMAGLVWLSRRRRAPVNPADAILMAWIALYSLVLSAPVHEFYVHYALPLAPPVAMLAGRGGVAAAEWLAVVFERRAVAATALCAVVAAIDLPFGAQLLTTRTQLRNRERTSDAVFVGKWLACRVASSARIAYDYFSYVPPVFQDATPTWGGSREWLSRLDPDIVIVYGVTAGAVMGDADHAEYYRCLAEARCGYERVLSRGEFTLYGRSGQTGAMSSRPSAPTSDCDASAVAGASATDANITRNGTSGNP
jgi:4-amino-4-deoxy-L-arabinose transferase-like glycosyltransferase